VDTLSYKTVSANKTNVKKEWFVVDAENETLGRLASKVAKMIRGKHKPYFTPHIDCGDNIIVVNAEKITMTGNKMFQKTYLSHSEYPGGQKSITAEQLLAKKPIALVERAVRGMLPKNRLGRALFGNLHVVEGTEHKFEAQKPKELKLDSIK
jgi:large subunit ribosomal protein L13